MTEFFEAFNPAARHLREQKDLQKVLVAQQKRGGRGPQPLDLDSGRIVLVKPGEQAPGTGPVVRPAATARELERAGRVAVRAWLDAAEVHHTDPWLAELRDAAARSEQGTVLVSLDDASLVGTLTWCPPGSALQRAARSTPEHTDEAGEAREGELRVLAVDPGSQNRGLGRVLVAHAIALARQAGCSSLLACAEPGVPAAVALYRSLGFVRAPQRDWQPRPGVTLEAFRLEL